MMRWSPPAPAKPLDKPDSATSGKPGALEPTIKPPLPKAPAAVPPLPAEVLSRSRPGESYAPATGAAGEPKLLGVCSFTETEVKCWKPDRSPLPALSGAVEAILRDDSYNSFRFGAKNRILVFTDPNRSGATQFRQSASNGSSFSSRPLEQSVEGLTAVFAQFSPLSPPELIVKTEGESGRPIPLVPRKGASASGDGVKLTVVSSGPVPITRDVYIPMENAAKPLKYFQIVLMVQDTKGGTLEPRFTLLQADGTSIRSVDEAGRPNSPALPTRRVGMDSPLPYPMLAVRQREDVGGGQKLTLLTNADPSLVPKIGIVLMRPKEIIFRNLPLDPKR